MGTSFRESFRLSGRVVGTDSLRVSPLSLRSMLERASGELELWVGVGIPLGKGAVSEYGCVVDELKSLCVTDKGDMGN
jgi:hypothetical protein